MDSSGKNVGEKPGRSAAAQQFHEPSEKSSNDEKDSLEYYPPLDLSRDEEASAGYEGSVPSVHGESTSDSAPHEDQEQLPPDGGLKAWLQVALAHLVVFNTWGYISAFGVFQTYYSTTLNREPSDISWVGSVQIFLLFFIGTFSGRATDAGLFVPVFAAGFVFQSLGTFMTSLSTEYWQLFLAQGLCTGIGNGLQFCPTMTLISTYFTTRKSTALGIVPAGSATGGIVYAVIVRQLLYSSLGFAWTVRILGFVTLGTGVLALCFLRTRLPPRKSGPLVEWGAFEDASYSLFCAGMFLQFWALYFAFYYVGSFARNIIGLNYTSSIDALLIMNGVGYLGRILPNILADRTIGALNSIIPCAFLCGVMFFVWASVKTFSGLLAFSAFYGLFAAGIQSMFPATLSSMTRDLKMAGTRMGMGFTIVSFACLTGPSIAGTMIQQNEGRYLRAQMWAGAMMVAGGGLMVAARVARVGWKLKAKI